MTDALPSAVDRFAYFMESLCRVIGDPRFGPLPAGPVVIAIWKRLRRIATRFAVLAALIRAGALPAPNPASPNGSATRRHRSPPTERATASRLAALAKARQAPRLPSRLGWLIRMRPGLHCFGGRLRHLLNDQEFLDLLAASPQIRKLIRSLCRMFGLPLIPILRTRRASERPGPTRKPSRSSPSKLARCHRPAPSWRQANSSRGSSCRPATTR